MDFSSVLMVGCGNMAGAMLDGWLVGGVRADTFHVYDPAAPALPLGVTALDKLPADGRFDAVVLGFKPQGLAEAAAGIAPLTEKGTIVISILAGVELATLQACFPQARRLVRLMPNLSAALGKAPLGLAASGLGQAERDALSRFLSPLGQPEWIDEDTFDLFTALIGSGPAFVYRFIGALAAGAEALGLTQTDANRLAVMMTEGAAALARASPDNPDALADRVASPHGTTRAGLDELDRDDALHALVGRALRSACERSAEMTRAARQ